MALPPTQVTIRASPSQSIYLGTLSKPLPRPLPPSPEGCPALYAWHCWEQVDRSLLILQKGKLIRNIVIVGLASVHTKTCRPSHGIILAVTLYYILQNVTTGGNQAMYRELSQLHVVISTNIQLKKTPRKRKWGWGCRH